MIAVLRYLEHLVRRAIERRLSSNWPNARARMPLSLAMTRVRP